MPYVDIRVPGKRQKAMRYDFERDLAELKVNGELVVVDMASEKEKYLQTKAQQQDSRRS